ncbi:MAG: 4Fe-4S dicluster domain-containing protein [Gammaproteobacteria bacterium]|nr:4Fe-4S dicluster domain-containing protein [Gammaproteobacteria bacterium]
MTTHGYLAREYFGRLLEALRNSGYRCVGPQVLDGAIQYRDLPNAQALPSGWRDSQAPGRYRLEHSNNPRQFAWANGPQALKPFLFAPRETLWCVERDARGALSFRAVLPEAQALAVIGVRACDLAALHLQDAHFLQGQFQDAQYAARRDGLFLVAVNCTHPAATCFCVSTGDGPDVPEANGGCDLVLDEVDDGFIVRSASERGASLIAQLGLAPVTLAQQTVVADQRQQAREAQTRMLPSRDLRPLLDTRLEHPRWADVAARCLSCGNCTSVCPTCFCHSDHESPAIDGSDSTHYREWDSCFTQGHSYIHGITLRADTRLRYRQWLTHKLGAWHDQYGRSGCVGCGRCISWCPVGIDITEEVAALAADTP